MVVSAQISLYPLGQDHLSPAIRKMQDALKATGLQVVLGPMSTLVTGDGAAVFDALKASFLRAATTGHVVMTATVSNACPVLRTRRMAWEIFEPVASRYEAWHSSGKGRRADRAERALLDWMLARLSRTEQLLDVGCGTGHFSRYLASRSLHVVGLDRSLTMLTALRSGEPRIVGVQADAQRLPFRDRAVDAALFVTSLEFLDDPKGALVEAVRVSRQGLMLLVLNRWSLGGLSRRVGPQASQPILGQAQDYSLRLLRTVVQDAAGDRLRGLHWQHGCFPRNLWPTPSGLPAGDVIALAAVLA